MSGHQLSMPSAVRTATVVFTDIVRSTALSQLTAS
jgi:hypothetical protein